MSNDVRIWHHGLVARWWAEFNQGGDDVAYFQRAIEESGGPVLDAGCGTGRLLLPFLRAGIDADGSDASADMLEWCRKSLDAEGLSATLYRQAMHDLDTARRYRTVVVCGAFGLGTSRKQDLEGLRRIHRILEPGGTLMLDHYLPNHESARSWSFWIDKPDLPRFWPDRGDRRRTHDGSELELRTRLKEFDPLEQTTTLEMRATLFTDGKETASETSAIDISLYFKNEIELMLTMAGFSDITVKSFPEDRPPIPWEDERIVFYATAVPA